jgi:hypothetical protein
MINTLVQYFIQHDHLDLPGIGTLKWVKQDAYWQDNQLVAPVENIILDLIDNKPSKQFYVYLADELSMSTEQAVLKYEQFCNDFLEKDMSQMPLGNLGVIQKKENQFHWISNYDASSFFKNITLSQESINHYEANLESTISNDNKWWIWALLITLFSCGLIYFKIYS